MRAKTIYKRILNMVGSNNVREDGAPVGIQAILEAEHCQSFSDVWSSLYHGRTYNKGRFQPGKMKTRLTDLEVVSLDATCSRRFKGLLREQVQLTVEHLVQRDESSTEKVSLNRGKYEFVEASWIRNSFETLHTSRR